MNMFNENWTKGYMADAPKVCESCIEAIEEEGVPEGTEATMAVDMGADIADHLCDQLESNGDIQCACACHPSKRWRGKNKDLTSEVLESVYRKTPPHQYLGRDGKPLVG
jgi:hypothetical protein